MPWRYNPLSGTVDYFQAGVQGPSLALNNAISTYNGTSGQIIQNSLALVQAGGGVQAQSFLTNRSVTELVTILPDYSMLSSNIELENGEIVIEQDGELVIL